MERFSTPSLALSTWGLEATSATTHLPREFANVSGRRVPTEPATSRVVCSLWTTVNGDFEEARDSPWLYDKGDGIAGRQNKGETFVATVGKRRCG